MPAKPVRNSGIIDSRVSCTVRMHTSDEVVCVALEAIGAVFNHGSIEHRRRVVADFNLLPRLRFLLHSKRDRNKEITCTALGALARGVRMPTALPGLFVSELGL